MRPRARYAPDSIAFRRGLRHDGSDAERRMWLLLRSRRLGGVKWRRQHPAGRFILDFYCPAARLAIELDGGSHFTPEGIRHDLARDAALREHGIEVLRFTNLEALGEGDAVVEVIWGALARSGVVPPHPDPLPPRTSGPMDEGARGEREER